MSFRAHIKNSAKFFIFFFSSTLLLHFSAYRVLHTFIDYDQSPHFLFPSGAQGEECGW